MEQLKLQMEKNFSKTMMDNLFHSDFKFHIKAIEALIKVCGVNMANKNKTDPLRAANIFMRNGMGHTTVSATQASLVTP